LNNKVYYIGFIFIFSFLCCLSGDMFSYNLQLYLSSPSKSKNYFLVFLPLNYPSKNDFLKDANVILDTLKKTSPFDEFFDIIKIWLIEASHIEEKKFFKSLEAFSCLDIKEEFLKNIFSSLRNFKLIIMDEKRFFSCAQPFSPMVTSLIILGKKDIETRKV